MLSREGSPASSCNSVGRKATSPAPRRQPYAYRRSYPNFPPYRQPAGKRATYMIHRIRHSRLLHLFWGAMAVFLLNLSVDAPDPGPRHLPEDLTHNDQESIMEWVAEVLLGFDDCFAEFDDSDGDERTGSFSPDLQLVLHSVAATNGYPPEPERTRAPYPQYLQGWSSAGRTIPGPPPRA